MRPDDRDLQPLGPFPGGANNVARETSVPRRQLREAVNVDLSDDGKVRRRAGYELIEPLLEPSSLFGVGRRGFLLSGDTLYAFEVESRDVSSPIPIYDGLRAGARMAAVLIEPDIFATDGDVNLRITPDNQVSLWTPESVGDPAVTVADNGQLTPGRYQVAVAARLASGEEGPVSGIAVVDVADDGSRLQVTLPPTAAPRLSIFMTKPNGTQLLFVASVPANAGTVSISAPQLGRAAATEFDPMPAGQHAMYFRSRLWVAADSMLVASEPFQYGMTQLDFNTMQFAEPITGIGTCGEAGATFFVGQESKVYLVRGDSPSELGLTEKYPFGMVHGTLTMVPGARLPLEAPPTEPVPVWLATNGVVCAGLPDGSVLPLTETSFAADVGSTGAGMFLQRDGESRYVATTAEPRENVFAMRDEVSYEIVRNGIPVTI